MIIHVRRCLRNSGFLKRKLFASALYHDSAQSLSSLFVSPPSEASNLRRQRKSEDKHEKFLNLSARSDINTIIARIHGCSGHDEVYKSLAHDQMCDDVCISEDIVDALLRKFKDDWQSALGVFKWAGSRPGYKNVPKAYDMMVDILGKMKQMDQMRLFLEEMRKEQLVTLTTIGKAMRRYSGAGNWEDAVRLFDELTTFGLEKNTESMNLLLDTLCKERKAEQARDVFLELKSHISPNANTFNIFIHGWCKVNRVDEAHWTIQEMKGHGFQPCVISYSTIIQFYCHRGNFVGVYDLLDEMEVHRCPANVITYTTIMSSLAKSEMYKEAIRVSERMKSTGCQPDTLFYNCLIHVLGRAGRVQDASNVFNNEMPAAVVQPNTSTYNSMIAMYCHHGRETEAFDLLKTLESSTLCKPDVHTYFPLLKSCFKTGKTDDLLGQLLDDMSNKHHLSLDLSSFTLLIHGLCRADKCEWAYRLFEEMIDLDMRPRHKTCHLLLEEVKQKHMYAASARIEDVLKKL